MKTFIHKDKLSITLDSDLVDQLDKMMLQHRETNRSKFIAFILRQVVSDNKKRAVILENHIMQVCKQLKALEGELQLINNIIDAEEKQKQIREYAKELKTDGFMQ